MESLMEDIDYFHLDIPVFRPVYSDNGKYNYSNHKSHKLLREVLCKASDGYCMYCYSRVKIDGKIYAHVEHAVEKALCKEKLKNCLPNLGLACARCNQSHKRKGELHKDSLPKEIARSIEKLQKMDCLKKSPCQVECSAYKDLRDCYVKHRRIVLQPFETRWETEVCLLTYDVLKREFRACKSCGKEAQKLVKEHIDKFCLNDTMCKTRELVHFCRDILDDKTKPIKGRYDNLIVDLFVDKIKNLPENSYKSVCALVVEQAFYKGEY